MLSLLYPFVIIGSILGSSYASECIHDTYKKCKVSAFFFFIIQSGV